MPLRKKTVVNISLVVVLSAVWGWIIYSTFAEPDAAEDLHAGMVTPPKPNSKEATKTYELQLDYRDPFLKGTSQRQAAANTPPNPRIQKPVKPAPKSTKVWPQMEYHGIVSNQDRGKKLGLISIDQQSHLLHGVMDIGEIRIRSYNADSVIVAYGEETKTLRTAIPN